MIFMNGKKKFYSLLVFYQLFLIAVVFFSVNGLIIFASAQAAGGDTIDYYRAGTAGMLGLAAGLSVGMAILGSGYALKTVGTSAIATLTEREEAFFKAFLVVALCEALAVYGLIIAILLWTKIPTPT